MPIATVKTARIPGLELARALTPPAIWSALYRGLVVRKIADAELYQPHFQPWRAPWFQQLFGRIRSRTVVPADRAWVVNEMATQSLARDGVLLEAGVFQGGTALMLKEVAAAHGRQLHLFDSFEGMQQTDGQSDRHRKGDFADTSLEAVQAFVGREDFVHYHAGWVPQSFAGLGDLKIAFAHIDLDLYQGVVDALAFVYPRMPAGGAIVFDDYGMASCPGARRGVEEFFADKPERPLALLTGQALVHKL